MRNRKEFKLGHFKGATDPDIKNQARWVPDFADEAAEKWASEGTKVLMYCTGGIRCEKASAFLRSKGVADVFQLSGGIHRYLEKYGAEGHFQVRGRCRNYGVDSWVGGRVGQWVGVGVCVCVCVYVRRRGSLPGEKVVAVCD